MQIQPVILCGGSGTRLWPLSRTHLPKQLLSFGSDRSLLQETVERVRHLVEKDVPVFICNDEYRFLVADHVMSLDLPAHSLLLEPEGRNTAPAIAMAAFRALEQDPLLLIMPSDHMLTDKAAFAGAIDKAAVLAEQGCLTTFGIQPTAPNTGYGYIQVGDKLEGGYQVRQFVEKPDLPTAEQYLASGDYYWNSGIFLFRASDFLEELKRFEPEIHEACRVAAEQLVEDLDFIRIDAEAFGRCPAKSVDYAVMEQTEKAAVVPLDAGWSDIGSYQSLWENLSQDADCNVIEGDVITRETSGSFIHAGNRLVAALGVSDLTIVETADAVLVADKTRSEDVKQIVEELAASARNEHMEHRRVYRPWGFYEAIDHGERYQVKLIQVKAGASISLQKHHHRAEHWVVVSGTAWVTKGDEVFELTENESTFIPIGETHRLENRGKIPLNIIEVQSGSYLGEDDIVRFEDQYGRSD